MSRISMIDSRTYFGVPTYVILGHPGKRTLVKL